MAQDVTITGTDGRFSAYLAEPAAARAPGLVLGQYICGVNRVMRAIADDFASRGFLTMVPDLFWRQEPNVQLLNDPTKPDPEEQKRALALNAGFNNDTGVVDLHRNARVGAGAPALLGQGRRARVLPGRPHGVPGGNADRRGLQRRLLRRQY